MNATPASLPRTTKRLMIASLLSFGFGLFVDAGDTWGQNPTESKRWALLGFWFAMGFMVLAGLLERIFIGLLGGLLKAGGKTPPHPEMQRGALLAIAGWFFGGFGAGLATGGLWRDASYGWVGLEILGPSLGLLLGIRLRRLMFTRKSSAP